MYSWANAINPIYAVEFLKKNVRLDLKILLTAI